MGTQRTKQGFSMLELVIVVAVIGVMVAVAIPNITSWRAKLEARSTARSVADVLNSARSNAIRTGTQHIVYFRINGVGTTDPNGTDLVDAGGNPVEVTMLQDDDGDCHIDGGEPLSFLTFNPNVVFGLTNTVFKVPTDQTNPATTTGSTFADPANTANPLRWLMFRPDGVPVTFSGNFAGCSTVGSTGSGNGGIYITNGIDDFAAVLTPLGGVRLHVFAIGTNGWTS